MCASKRLELGRAVLTLVMPLALATGCRSHSNIVGGKTDVVLIVIDTLRADHLTAWGYPWPTTPNLDQLAANGVRFSNFFSTASWTRPAMASLLTGLYPRTTGIYEEKFDRLADDLVTLPELLSERGYKTIGLTANPNINTSFGFEQGFDHYGDSGVIWPWMPSQEGRRVFQRGVVEVDRADLVTDLALDAFDRYLSADQEKPFYLQILYIDPHRPWDPPAEHASEVEGSPSPGYDGEIRFVDFEIGRLLKGLKRRGALSDTLVVITSDHGEGLHDHPSVPLSEKHGSILYDSVLHIPLIFSHPSLPAGRVIETMASSIDLLPTIMSLLGWTAPLKELPGRPLAMSIPDAENQSSSQEAVFAETDWRVNRKTTVRSKTHRLVLNHDSFQYQMLGVHEGSHLEVEEERQLAKVPAEEFYDLSRSVTEDPKNNLVDQDSGSRADLEKLLSLWQSSLKARPPLGRAGDDSISSPQSVSTVAPEVLTEDIDITTLERLRALGYLND